MISTRDFLKKQNYSEKTIDGGIERLLKKWEGLFIKVHSKNMMNDIDFFEYLNELDGRRIIKEILENCFVDEGIREKIKQFDRNFKKVTFEISHHISGKHLDLKYDKNKFWWYYRVPNAKKEIWKLYYASSL